MADNFTCKHSEECVCYNIGNGCEGANGETCLHYGKCDYCINRGEEICCDVCDFVKKFVPIYADKNMFSDGKPKGFKPTGYRININHPAIHPLYENFYKNNGIEKTDRLSDRQRFHFEQIIFKMIKAGMIVVAGGIPAEMAAVMDVVCSQGEEDTERAEGNDEQEIQAKEFTE